MNAVHSPSRAALVCLLASWLAAAAAFAPAPHAASPLAGSGRAGASHSRLAGNRAAREDGASFGAERSRVLASSALVPSLRAADALPRRRAAAVRMELDPATVVHLDGREQFDSAMLKSEGSGQLVVVKYYASWCRACKALGPKVRAARCRPTVCAWPGGAAR
jgi:hypothetical protein